MKLQSALMQTPATTAASRTTTSARAAANRPKNVATLDIFNTVKNRVYCQLTYLVVREEANKKTLGRSDSIQIELDATLQLFHVMTRVLEGKML